VLVALIITVSISNIYANENTITVNTKDEYYQKVVAELKSGKKNIFFVYGENKQGDFLEEKGLVKGLAEFVRGNLETDNYVIYNIKMIKYKKHIKEKEGSIYELEFIPYTDENEEAQLQMLIERKINEFELESKTDYEKIKIVHDYILEEISYDETGSRFSAYEGLMSQKGVCSAYCLAFQKIMDMLEIPCCCIYYGNHEWNSVYLDGKWYNMDLTWNDAGIEKYNYIWFLQNDDYFKRYHSGYTFCTAESSYELKDFDYRYEIIPDSDTQYRLKVISKADGKVALEGVTTIQPINENDGITFFKEESQVVDISEDKTTKEPQKVSDDKESNEFGIFHTFIFFAIGMAIGGVILWGVLKKTEQQM
jgi:hypothetical protein